MMTKVKIFTQGAAMSMNKATTGLEVQVNDWLQANDNRIEVVNVSTTVDLVGSGGATLTILYHEK